MTLTGQIKAAATAALKQLFPQVDLNAAPITISQTKPEFQGDYTIVLFPFVKQLRTKPDELGRKLGEYLLEKTTLFSSFEIVAGFLNLSVRDAFWPDFLLNHFNDAHYGEQAKKDCRVMVEYSSPNTNKPLHFGHLRNNFLGYAVSEILKSNGKQVVKANLINDRGIHICKSMVAWQRYANGATPASTGIKGDHLVGDYYVRFNDELNKEIAPELAEIYSGKIPSKYSGLEFQIIKQNLDHLTQEQDELRKCNGQFKIAPFSIKEYSVDAFEIAVLAIEGKAKWKDVFKLFEAENSGNKSAEKFIVAFKKVVQQNLSHENAVEDCKADIKEVVSRHSEIMNEAQKMLRLWEANDPETRKLWAEMNGWVYTGFDKTYARLGINFDKVYHESETYLLGKKIVEDGLQKGVLFQKEDGSIWIDLTADGLDQKLLLRGDGTSVYMTQDLGTAVLKYNDFKLQQSIYVIADEQNYHMQVLKLILEKLGEPCAAGIHHLSYGMVELPSGKMKSREGTVVDADDMIDEMINLAKEQTEAAGKTTGFTNHELEQLYETIGLGALKFYLLRVDPKKKMIFNPKESIDLHGFSATFIQFSHARMSSILRKVNLPLLPDKSNFQAFTMTEPIAPAEKDLLVELEQYPLILESAGNELNPSVLCNYAFHLSQLFGTFSDLHSIVNAESEEKKYLRLMIIIRAAQTLRHSMNLLGIKLPEKM